MVVDFYICSKMVFMHGFLLIIVLFIAAFLILRTARDAKRKW